MKKLFNYGLAALVATGLLASCGDDENKQDDPAPKVTQTATVEGSWNYASSHIQTYDANGNKVGSQKNESYPPGKIVVTFTAPSTYTAVSYGSNFSGTYQTKPDSLIVFISSLSPAETYRYKVDSLTTARMVLTFAIKNSIGGKNVYTAKYTR